MIRPDFPGQSGKKHNALAGRTDELIHFTGADSQIGVREAAPAMNPGNCWVHGNQVMT
jgi:hypothetical protein